MIGGVMIGGVMIGGDIVLHIRTTLQHHTVAIIMLLSSSRAQNHRARATMPLLTGVPWDSHLTSTGIPLH